MSTTWNKELENWLADKNECVCGTEEPDYCTCSRDHNINDFFAEIFGENGAKPEVKQIFTGYVLYRRDVGDTKQIPFITLDNKTAHPVTGVDIPEHILIVEVVGKQTEHGAIIAESVKYIANKPGINNIVSGEVIPVHRRGK